ncbi:MAG: RIP metalloprotease RseP [Elusimicrobiales bacterium]|nr:RIP metalloprotease RseP [Elusimicrobiales bacterium]
MILSVIAVIFTFGLVIFLHELGHFIACRIAGMRVIEFSLGFGPEIIGWGPKPPEEKKDDTNSGENNGAENKQEFRQAAASEPAEKGQFKGTRYSIRWIPLGGYVQPAGEIVEEAKGEPDEYYSKPWYSRLGVALAGPAMNYVLAFILFTAVILATGNAIPKTDPVIGDISDGYPAEVAGMKAGDRIVSINGKETPEWKNVTEAIHASAEKEITIVYERESKQTTVKLTPKKTTIEGKDIGLVGIAPEVTYEPVPFFKAVSNGAYQCWYWTALTVTTLKDNIVKRQKPDLAGPVGIVTVVSKAAHKGYADFFFLIALISVAIGFFNLLPIPLVDGGQSLLFIAEGIMRKKPSLKVVEKLNIAGFAILIGIFVFATYSDIMRLKTSHDGKKAREAAAASKEAGEKTSSESNKALEQAVKAGSAASQNTVKK